MTATEPTIEEHFARVVATAERFGMECLITLKSYRIFYKYQAWMEADSDNLKRQSRSFEIDPSEIRTGRCLLNWTGPTPAVGEIVATIKVDAQLKIVAMPRWKVVKIVGGVGTVVSDTDDVDDVDTGELVGIRRMLVEPYSA